MLKVVDAGRLFAINLYDLHEDGFCKLKQTIEGIDFETFIVMMELNTIPHRRKLSPVDDYYELSLIFQDSQLSVIENFIKRYKIETTKEHINSLIKRLEQANQELFDLINCD